MNIRDAVAHDTLIGKRIPKLDAPQKARGKTRYVHDIDLPGQLHAKILRSAHAHANIRSIDVSAARALAGVHAVITADDVPYQRPIGIVKDHLPLKKGRVLSLRDEIAAVAAETDEIAAEAIKLIKVDYEPLPEIKSAMDAMRPGAPALHGEDLVCADASGRTFVVHTASHDNVAMKYDFKQGDLARGEGDSDIIVEDVFWLHYVTHCCMGVSGVLVDVDPRGGLTMYSNTQVPFLHRREFAELLGIDPGRVRIIQPPIGGGFGSKLDIYPFEPIAIYLSQITGRPIKLVFTREEEFMASPTRQPVLLKMRSGCTKDGVLTFREVDTIHDNGAYTSWGATTPLVMIQTFGSLYRVPDVVYRTRAVYSNNPYAGSFRGYGNLQATFAVEAHMDRLAEKIGMDPLEFRMKNAQEQGEVAFQGLKFNSCGFKECLTTAAERSHYQSKQRENIERWKDPNPIKRGVGLASMLHVGGGAKIYQSDGCGTILKLDDFAHVTLITGASEIGQGSETVLAQLVCEELGLPISSITVVNNDTDIKPWDVGVHASRTTFVAGNSAIGAARKAKEKVLAAAAAKFGGNAAEYDMRRGAVVSRASGKTVVDLAKLIRSLHFSDKADLVMTMFYYEPPSQALDRNYFGDVSAAYSWATQVVEVEVDTRTGVVRLLKVTAASDVGRVLNRLGLEGQIEGGIVMGQGYALTENLDVEDCEIRNPNFRDYKLVTAPEIPEMDLSFIESMDGEGPQGAKGVGEAPSICVAAAVANAIYNATGVRITALPFTPERVYRALNGALDAPSWDVPA